MAAPDQRVVGSNFLDERNVIAGLGPITVDPGTQNHAVGRQLMEAAQQRRQAVTTDYVVDETATLLRARGLTKLLTEFFRLTETIAGSNHGMDFS